MSEHLKRFENSLSKKFTDLESRQKGFVTNLKTADSELKEQPNGSAAAKNLNEYLTNSKKLNDEKRKFGIEALKKLQQTAAGLDH